MKNALFAGISNKKDSDDSDNEAKNEEVKKTEPEPMIDLLNMDDSAGGTNLLSNDPPQQSDTSMDLLGGSSQSQPASGGLDLLGGGGNDLLGE